MRKDFWIMVFEAFFGGFYFIITRSLTPIFLVSIGYSLGDLLLLNAFAGLLSLLIAQGLKNIRYSGVDIRAPLLIAHVLERILWCSIPFFASDKVLIIIIYGLAMLVSIPTSFFLGLSFFSLFKNDLYRKLLSYRTIMSSIASILGQTTMIFVLAFITEPYKYFMLYYIAFAVGIVASIIITLSSQIKAVMPEKIEAGAEEEVKAVNIYLLLVLLLSASNLLSISWVPRIMRDLGAPDYFAALIGFTQTLANIVISMFWIRQGYIKYRYAITGLALTPLLVFMANDPYYHIPIAVLYSFSLVGTNFFASFVFSTIIHRIGAPKASILLSSSNAFALMIASSIGYFLSSVPFFVFLLACIFGFIGLVVALTAIPELALLPPSYTRLYSRTLYMTSIASYNFIVFTVSETVKATIKLLALIFALILLFIIYRTIYYIIVLSGG